MCINRKRFLVTGGAGFIGSAFIRYGLQSSELCEKIVNFDKLTYAADLRSVASVENDPRYLFVQGDICDQVLVEKICQEQEIDTIVHFAAESHVDNSIEGPAPFLETNVMGTFALLEVVRRLPHVHFHHVSTDEVYGSLSGSGKFSEQSAYAPNSPYSASKAASDHFVRAYAHTYNLSTTLTHCTNNYGPYQFKEKLIPRLLTCCLKGQSFPIYGTGENVRDWLYVEDHVEALWWVLVSSPPGAVYDIGGNCEMRNIDLVTLLIELLAAELDEDPARFFKLMTFVSDRPGHDLRYAIDASKIAADLGWRPLHSLEEGLKKTVKFYTQVAGDLHARR